MQIRITPEEMETVAAKFGTGASQVEDIRRNLETTMNGLINNWEGATQKSYVSEFETRKKNMQEFVELLNVIERELKVIAQNFRNADQQ